MWTESSLGQKNQVSKKKQVVKNVGGTARACSDLIISVAKRHIVTLECSDTDQRPEFWRIDKQFSSVPRPSLTELTALSRKSSPESKFSCLPKNVLWDVHVEVATPHTHTPSPPHTHRTTLSWHAVTLHNMPWHDMKYMPWHSCYAFWWMSEGATILLLRVWSRVKTNNYVKHLINRLLWNLVYSLVPTWGSLQNAPNPNSLKS